MPYGIPKEFGGDSPENERYMQGCIKSIQEKDKSVSDESAIRICKTSLAKSKGNKAKASELVFELMDEIK